MSQYTINVSDSNDLISDNLERSIQQIADAVMININTYVAWNGVLDLEIRILPHSQSYAQNIDGFTPSLGSLSWNGSGWTNNGLNEALTGVDPVPGDADVGCYFYLAKDGTPKLYSTPFWFDPMPYNNDVVVPNDHYDFFGVLTHEVFHSLGAYEGTVEFDRLLKSENGNMYFVGEKTTQLYGGDLPYDSGQSHYGNSSTTRTEIDSGLLYYRGNYYKNRLDIGKIDLAMLEDLGHNIKTYGDLPLFEEVGPYTTKGTPYLRYMSSYLDEELNASELQTSELIVEANKNLFTIAKTGENWAISGQGIGTDTLSGFKRLEFSDGTLALDIDAGDTAGQAYRLYQAAFARTPDMPGVAYHMNDMEANGLVLSNIANNFLASPEFKSKYGENPTDDEYVNLLYQNVLGRSADPVAEVGWYKEKFDTGAMDWAAALIGFAESPENIALVGPDIVNGIWLPDV